MSPYLWVRWVIEERINLRTIIQLMLKLDKLLLGSDPVQEWEVG